MEGGTSRHGYGQVAHARRETVVQVNKSASESDGRIWILWKSGRSSGEREQGEGVMADGVIGTATYRGRLFNDSMNDAMDAYYPGNSDRGK